MDEKGVKGARGRGRGTRARGKRGRGTRGRGRGRKSAQVISSDDEGNAEVSIEEEIKNQAESPVLLDDEKFKNVITVEENEKENEKEPNIPPPSEYLIFIVTNLHSNKFKSFF